MRLLKIQPKALSNNEATRRKQWLLGETLEMDEIRIKRFIRISLTSLKTFHSREEIEERTTEIFQQMALRALETAEIYDANRSAYSWLNGFAVNLIKQTQSRVLSRREKFEDGFEDFERIENLRRKIETTRLPEEQFYQKYEREDERRCFEERISHLKDDYQKILRLHYFEDLEISEIAPRLGKSVGTAQRQLNRAENRLREILGGKEKK